MPDNDSGSGKALFNNAELSDTKVNEGCTIVEVAQEDSEEDDLDPQDIEDYHYNSGENTFHFHELAAVIKQHMNASEMQPNGSPPALSISGREEHNKQQQQVWRIVSDKVAADNSIPTALFDPPRTCLQVRFAAWPREGHYCCPCDLHEDQLQYVEIRAEKGSACGITKDMFLTQIAENLCGNEDGSDWTIGDRYSRPVIDHFDWKSDGGIMGHLFAMTKGFVE